LEDIMSTQVDEKRAATTRWIPAAAAAAVVVVAGIVGAMALGGGSEPLALTAGAEDPTQMCIVFSVEELAKAPVAFEGTVTSVDGETVSLTVDHWFAGGEADEVVVTGPAGMEALIGGIPFTAGETYLITAYDGTVNYCGFSGPATPELRASFEAAFGA
jgi:hypothetical protein